MESNTIINANTKILLLTHNRKPILPHPVEQLSLYPHTLYYSVDSLPCHSFTWYTKINIKKSQGSKFCNPERIGLCPLTLLIKLNYLVI